MSTCASWVISPLARARARSQVQADERADSAAADAAAVAKAKALVEKKLEEQIVLAAKAMEKIKITPIIADADVMNRRKSLAGLESKLKSNLAALPSTAAKTRALKGLLQRYADGMGLTQLKPKEYASGKPENAHTIGKEGSEVNIAFLFDTAVAAFATIRAERLVLRDEPVVPELHRRSLPQLGAPTLQRVEVEREQLRDEDDVRAAAVEYLERPRERRTRAPAVGRQSGMPEITEELAARPEEVRPAHARVHVWLVWLTLLFSIALMRTHAKRHRGSC